jgi:dephospho-CoA kinase
VADAWGGSWGSPSAWGNSWGASVVVVEQVIVRGQRKGSKRKRYDEELDRDAFGEWLRMDAKRRREEEAIMHLLFD